LRPDFAESWHNRGSAFLALKRHADALASYDRALTARPDYAEAWKSRGTVLVLLQRYGDALAAFDSAIRIRTNDAGAGRDAHACCDWKERGALASYDEALRLQPGKPDVLYIGRAFCLFSKVSESQLKIAKRCSHRSSYPYARGLLMLRGCSLRLARFCEERETTESRNAVPPRSGLHTCGRES